MDVDGKRWRVSLQSARIHTRAACTGCHTKFGDGELRVSSGRAKKPRYIHLACLNTCLGSADDVEGYGTLTAQEKQLVDAWLADRSGPEAPMQEESLVQEDFSAERALQNMEWWERLVDDGLLNQAATLSDVPGSLVVAVGEAREAVAQYTLTATSANQAAAGWKCFLAMDRLLFGELKNPVAEEQHSKVSERVAERLHDFWAGRWDSLWADTCVETRQPSTSSADKQKAQRVEKLLLQGEISKAAGAAWGPPSTRSPSETAAAFAKQGASVPEARFAGPLVRGTECLQADVTEYLRTIWRKTPKGSGTGVQGDRFEHWAPLAATPDKSPAAAALLSRLAGGDVPQDVLDLVLAGRLLGLAKKDDGTRVLACGSVPRRLVGKAVCQVRREAISEAVGRLQFGVGVSGGTEVLHKILSAKAEEFPHSAFVSLDVKNAFPSIRRQAVLEAVQRRCPDLFPLAKQWYNRASRHVVTGKPGDGSRMLEQFSGLDQGCPLSPAFFAIAIADALADIDKFAKSLDRDAAVYAYLDDIYFFAKLAVIDQILDFTRKRLQVLGLELNLPKTRVWFPAGAPPQLPGWADRCKVQVLPCLGSSLSFVRPRQDNADDSRDVEIGVEDCDTPAKACDRLKLYVSALTGLHQQGLPSQHCFTLLRNYVNGAVTHFQRARVAPEGAWSAFDDEVSKAVGTWLGSPLSSTSRSLLFLPFKLGGLGFGAAARRADAAWLASWNAARPLVRAEQGHATEELSAAAAPKLTAAERLVSTRLRTAGAPVAGARSGRSSRQRDYTVPLQKQAQTILLQALPPEAAALVRSQCDLGASSWLHPPRRNEHKIEDDVFIVSVRRRLLFDDPAAAEGRPCQHKAADAATPCGATDNQVLGAHAVSCGIGPGRIRRHDEVKGVLADWLRERHGVEAVHVEQHIPAWDKVTDEGAKHAVLDIVLSTQQGKVAVDVSVTDVSAPSASSRARGKTFGRAARVRELEKHRRYPGHGLVAAVLETGGAAGRELHAFLRSHASTDPALRSLELQDIRQRLAVALQRGNAALLLSAAGERSHPWLVAVQAAGRVALRRVRR